MANNVPGNRLAEVTCFREVTNCRNTVDGRPVRRRCRTGASIPLNPRAGTAYPRDYVLLEPVLEGDSEDVGSVVLPVLTQEDCAHGGIEEGREGARLPVVIDELLVGVEELAGQDLGEVVLEGPSMRARLS